MNTMTAQHSTIPNKLAKLIRAQLVRNAYRVEERQALRESNIRETDEFTVFIGDSSIDLTVNPSHPATHAFFAYGKCAYLAYRVHQLTNLPVALWTEGDNNGWTGHVAVKTGEDEYLDIEGIVSNDDICDRYYWNNKEPQVFPDFTHLDALMGHMPTYYGDLGKLEKELIDYLAKRLISENGI